jgi:diamine N-acetyltransferase
MSDQISDQTVAATSAITSDAVVSLRPVTADNLGAVLRLKVTPQQEQFVAPNPVSIAQGAHEPLAWPRAIYADETPVGFVMLYDDPFTPVYYLWRLMIDARYQHMGFARQAMTQVIDYVLGRPNATELRLSYVPAAGGPQPFYASLGFVDTGEVDDGENVMRLDLREHPRPAAPPSRPLTHVVLMQFQEPSPTVLRKAAEMLRGLKGKVPELRSIEVGQDVLHSGRSYDLALITRFDTLADMQHYQEHPEHVAVLQYLRSVLAASVAVDYEQP